jgi:S1-C subfamily serine protease
MKRILLYLLGGSCLLFGGSAALTLSPHPTAQVSAQSKEPQPKELDLGTADVAQQLSERFERIAQKVCPAVVAVEAVRPGKPLPSGSGKSKPIEESGSGVLVKLPGRSGTFALTNNHVITGAAPEHITLHLADGRVFRPNKVWADPESDVAVLGLDGGSNLPTVPLGDSDKAKVGHWVLAIGSPFGLNQSVTHGIISARERGQVSLNSTIRIKDFLQTDAAINPGSSGGPLVNLGGEVIGINTAIASSSGNNSGVAFSIPVNLVKRVSKQLLEKGSVSRGYLGMQLAQSFEPADALKLGLDRVQGAWVDKVYADTPAAAAKLRNNDVVLRVENVVIRNENHLINLISVLPPGQKIRLQVWRDRSVITLDAVVGDWTKAKSQFGAVP